MGNFCQRCGTGLPPSARFCSSCGAVVPTVAYIPGRPLMRPIAGRQIGGVCIGLAQTYGWDVAVVRVIAVIGTILTGVLGVVYLACWVGIPEEGRPVL